VINNINKIPPNPKPFLTIILSTLFSLHISSSTKPAQIASLIYLAYQLPLYLTPLIVRVGSFETFSELILLVSFSIYP
jgi:hypothetical protein